MCNVPCVQKKGCGFLVDSQLSLPQGKPSLSLSKYKICKDRDNLGLFRAFPLPCMVSDNYQMYSICHINE